MNDFAGKLENFWNVFLNAGGYREVLKGLQNTLTIAVLGLLIGIVIGTVIAAVRVAAEIQAAAPRAQLDLRILRRPVPRHADGRAVACILLRPAAPARRHTDAVGDGGDDRIRPQQRRVHFRDYAFRHPVRRQRADGGRPLGRAGIRRDNDAHRHPAGGQEHPSHARQRVYCPYQGNLGRQLCRSDRPVRAFNNIGSNSYEFMVPYLVMALIYIALVMIISAGIKLMERSLRKSDRSR